MTILKTVAMLATAILVGGTTLANAQAQGSSGPDGMSAAAAATNPPPPKHHKKMYMSAKNGSMHKKGSQKMGTNGGY
jgi:F0F1-type ATP synthase membrane subunit c/vacuolar-type H+-ATPase subunit K